MKFTRVLALFVSTTSLLSLIVSFSGSATAAGNPNCSAVDGDYIVTFAPGISVDKELKSAPGKSIDAKFKYKNAINGFAAKLSAEQVCAFEKRPNIQSIELDGLVSIEATRANATWGLDRIDSKAPSSLLDTAYNFTTSGVGVTAYVIDTGIQSNHPDLVGAVIPGFSSIAGGTEDCNGHGTHVAGTIGGNIYGVASDVTLVPIRVLGCDGSGTNSGVIAGVDHVKGAAAGNTGKSVANMSLGGAISSALDTAVNNLISSGVVVVVAAGNSRADACKSSPARVPAAITVAASDRNNAFASFSNRGSCVDITAPGVSITSSWINSGVNTISGTSMAAPHVAGAVARYLQGGSNAAQLVKDSALNAIASVPRGTTNKFLYLAPSK
jgi:subtilisin family serine protease